MQDTDMREKLLKIIEAYEDVQAKMGDPAVLADQKEYNRLAKEYANQGPLAKKAREYVQAADDLAAAREMLADSDMRVRPGGDRRDRRAAAGARRGHQVHAHPGRPGR